MGPHDGKRVEVAPYRRMMSFVMRGRNESAVYFEQRLDTSKTLPWLEAYNARVDRPVLYRSLGQTASRAPDDRPGKATIFHVVLHALASVLHERERLNRFTVGQRTYQRDRVVLSFAAKKGMRDDAPLATIKRAFERDETFAALVSSLGGEVAQAKSDQRSAMDRELKTLLSLPGPVLALGIRLVNWLYSIGLAPRSLVDTDPLYASAFVANLGSLQMDAAYHHLYEHGNCPLFVTIGRITDTAIVIDGQLAIRPCLVIRYTYDERVEDGFYAGKALELLRQRVEDPASWIA